MLVNLERRLAPGREDGSAILSVLVVMLVLSVAGLALAAIVQNTTGMIVDSRSSVQSRATADAGLAEVVASVARGEVTCGDSDDGIGVDGPDSETYDYDVTCGAGFATVRVNADVGGARTSVQSVYAHSSAPGAGGDMVFFGTGNVTFTDEVKTSADGRLLDIVVPHASFTCQALIPGNITAQGNIKANGGCTIKGSATSSTGIIDMCCGSDTIEGNLQTSGTGTNTVRGTLKSSLHTNGAVEFGWEGKKVGGSVIANGDVRLGNVRIDGTLTMPSGKSFQQQGGVISGGRITASEVAGPTPPTLPSWFEYKFDVADWSGYTVLTLKASGAGNDTCSAFNSHPASGWAALATYSTDLIVDARACGSLSSNSGTKPTVAVKKNLVLLAKGFDLSGLTIKAAAGVASKPKVWIMTEDIDPADGKPTCPAGYGNIGINGTVTDLTVKAMAYTPCVINIAGKAYGISDKWNGTFYGGGWNYGGGLTFSADPIGVPGMGPDEDGGAAESGLGALISTRDVPYEEIGG